METNRPPTAFGGAAASTGASASGSTPSKLKKPGGKKVLRKKYSNAAGSATGSGASSATSSGASSGASNAASAASIANSTGQKGGFELYGDAESRRKRFEKKETAVSQLDLLKSAREKEREFESGAGGLGDTILDHNQAVVGTCMDMCPKYEIELRKHQHNVDKYELNKLTGEPDDARFVKAFHRPAAGMEQALKSDIRPPSVLKKTLDYLFSVVLQESPNLADSHAFLRDRTRSIRQDFTLQSDHGPLAIECHEHIARYHILCLHQLRDNPEFSEQQEVEQLQKVLKSLVDFYSATPESPAKNEPEFRSYYLLLNMFNAEIAVEYMALSPQVYQHPYLQNTLRLRRYVQKRTEYHGEQIMNLNMFTRFFKMIVHPSFSYLQACIAENHFMFVRRKALKAMKHSYLAAHNAIPLVDIKSALYFDSIEETALFCSSLGIALEEDPITRRPSAAVLHRMSSWDEFSDTQPISRYRFSQDLVNCKLGETSPVDVINGTNSPMPSTIKRLLTSPVTNRYSSAAAFELSPAEPTTFTLQKQQKLQFTPPPLFPAPKAEPVNLFQPQTIPEKLSKKPEELKQSKIPQPKPLKPVLDAEKVYLEAVESLAWQVVRNIVRDTLLETVQDAFGAFLYETKLLKLAFRTLKARYLQRFILRKEAEEKAAREREKIKQHGLTLKRLSHGPIGGVNSGRRTKLTLVPASRRNQQQQHQQQQHYYKLSLDDETFWQPVPATLVHIHPLWHQILAHSLRSFTFVVIALDDQLRSWFERKCSLSPYVDPTTKTSVALKISKSKEEATVHLQTLNKTSPGAVIYTAKYDTTLVAQLQALSKLTRSCALITLPLLIVIWTPSEPQGLDRTIQTQLDMADSPWISVKVHFVYSVDDARLVKFFNHFVHSLDSISDTDLAKAAQHDEHLRQLRQTELERAHLAQIEMLKVRSRWQQLPPAELPLTRSASGTPQSSIWEFNSYSVDPDRPRNKSDDVDMDMLQQSPQRPETPRSKDLARLMESMERARAILES